MEKFAQRVDGGGAAIRAVRRGLVQWLQTTPCDDGCFDSVQLVVSELVSNALVHTSSPPAVEATVTGHRLHIEVRDDLSAPPAVRSPSGALGGYGLNIVDALAVEWGWRRTTTGKVVWADISL